MKATLVFFLALFAGTALATLHLQRLQPFGEKAAVIDKVEKVGLDLCPSCVSLMGQGINILLNYILNVGVVGSCEKLCSQLPTQLEQVVCNLLCDYVGLEEFVKVIEKADLDPIYFCELIDVCPIKDDGDAKITSLKVEPLVIRQGREGTIELLFQTMNGIGTGEVSFLILTQDGFPVGENELIVFLAPGNYNVTLEFKTRSCDPSQEPCEMWLPGNYTVRTAVCNGECGSKHPHSQVYDTASATFNVTEKMP